MNFLVLATPRQLPPRPPSGPQDQRIFWLESWDGSKRIRIGSARGGHPWNLQVGATGLQVAPTDVARATVPGGAGTRVEDVITLERQVLLPMSLKTLSQEEQFGLVQELRDLTDPTVGMTVDGNFRLVCSSGGRTRQVGLVYSAGLEGAELGVPVIDKIVLSCVAPQPFAEDRTEQSRPFGLIDESAAFLGSIWPASLSRSDLLSAGGPVVLDSAVPVWPVLELEGPVDECTITSDTGMSVHVQSAVQAGKVLRIVTDPRGRSIRLDGAAAAGMLARGSRLVPFGRGVTTVTVSAPGATSASQLRMTWRGLHRSLW